MKNKVLITGATGPTGLNAIHHLLELHIPVRAMVHSDDDRSRALITAGAEVVVGDLSDFNSVRSALEGIQRAYFVYPATVSGIMQATAYFAQAAREVKLELIVNMSQRTARRESNSHAAQNHWISEQLFDYSGVPVTHLRPTLFDEWLLYFAKPIKEQNRLISPFGEASYASLAGEDIGRVIASVLANPKGHVGKTYELYGPHSMTQYDVADMLTELLKRKITYEPMTIHAFAELIKPVSTPYFVQHISAVSQDFRDGIMTGNNNLVEEITGRKPLPLRDFIKSNIQMFQ